MTSIPKSTDPSSFEDLLQHSRNILAGERDDLPSEELLAQLSNQYARRLRRLLGTILSENSSEQHRVAPSNLSSSEREADPSFLSRETPPPPEKEEGEALLRAFLSHADSPHNLLCFDRGLSPSEMERRRRILKSIRKLYLSGWSRDRKRLRQILGMLFEIPQMDPALETYLRLLEHLPTTKRPGGAENTNLIYRDHSGQPQVLKVSGAERQGRDFASILRITEDLYTVLLRLDGDIPSARLRIHVACEGAAIYHDGKGNLRRLLRQGVARGIPLKDLPREEKEKPAFQEALRAFQERIQVLHHDGIELDMTDSSRHPLSPTRYNPLQTGNVFVQVPTRDDEPYLFTIVDPDVFHRNDDKLSPVEHLLRKDCGAAEKYLAAAKTLLINLGRRITHWLSQFHKH